MDWYEKELMALAVEEAPGHRVAVWRDEEGWWRAECDIPAPTPGGTYLSGALAVLIRDVLNVEVPERPSAERVAMLRELVGPTALGFMRDAGFLVSLALLEGGEA